MPKVILLILEIYQCCQVSSLSIRLFIGSARNSITEIENELLVEEFHPYPRQFVLPMRPRICVCIANICVHFT